MARSFEDFVEHPRFGRGPRITGLDVETDHARGVFVHWHATPAARVPGTAIAADPTRQATATVPVTHYYDVERRCRDCGRPFLFFAEEQRHWYEELGLRLEIDCVRCVPCRRRRRGLEAARARYEQLVVRSPRSPAETLELAEHALSLVEAGWFPERRLEEVRGWLARLDGELAPDEAERREALRARARRPEASSRHGGS